MLLCRLKLNFGFTSLSTDYVSGSFWITKITYILRTSFPLPVFVWIRIKLAVSCYFRLLDQTVSVPCPPSNVNICTPESFLFAPSSHRTAPKEPSTNPTSTNLVPESFFPWRPDHTYLVSHSIDNINFLFLVLVIQFLVFTSSLPLFPYSWRIIHYVPDYYYTNKHPFIYFVLRSVLCMWVRSIANKMTEHSGQQDPAKALRRTLSEHSNQIHFHDCSLRSLSEEQRQTNQLSGSVPCACFGAVSVLSL
ncbi:hypothetical protein ILYODFUR_039013 [Ilyodon furcidens]|uniref:Uncharacterized protein n=1 Tax=Ilyodon furcidens TaxID=33524 RepID=A0ABV0UC04_9TELE